MNVEAMRKRFESFVGLPKKVRVERRTIHEPFLSGFVLAVGREWVFFHIFNDFTPDGYVAFRLRDVVEIHSGAYERHWERMLAGEGLLGGLAAPFVPPLDDVSSLLKHLQQRGENVIVEREHTQKSKDDAFHIGRILTVDFATVSFADYDALGRWETVACHIPLAEVTRIQVRSNYERIFSKYLDGPCLLTGESAAAPPSTPGS